MKLWPIMIFLLTVGTTTTSASDNNLAGYIANFDYASRREMKISSKKLIDLLEDGKAVLVDIRFKEEQQIWGPSFALSIPLNELPERLNELPKGKIIVTACPHKDRAIIAMTYLRSKGIKARYLTDGLIGLAENLRGDDALYFLKNYQAGSASTNR
jgi:rhodanese-related sulfurtransferase